MNIITQPMESIPPNSNPFRHDMYHMGIPIAKNCMIMYSNDKEGKCGYIIIVNSITGERLRVSLTGEAGLVKSIPEQLIS